MPTRPRPMQTPAPEHLVIAPAWVGDIVMAQTLFKLLHSLYPDHALDVLAPAWAHPLLARMPEVRNALPLPLQHGELGLLKRWRIARTLHHQHHYDRAYVLPNSFKSALIPLWSGIKKRIGWLGENRFGLLNDWRRLQKTTYPLMIQRFAALAFPKEHLLPENLPKPALKIEQTSLHETCQRLGITLDRAVPILALCPGAEFGPSKRWPIQYYATLARHFQQLGWQVWIMGSARDQAVTANIKADMLASACFDLAGRTTLAEAVDLLSAATVVATNDSGLMHIAAAVGKPLVAFYGSTSPGFTPPLSEQVKILQTENLACAPCFQRDCPLQHHQCMQSITPEHAIAAVEALMAATPTAN